MHDLNHVRRIQHFVRKMPQYLAQCEIGTKVKLLQIQERHLQAITSRQSYENYGQKWIYKNKKQKK